jgi:hypothetical protein
MAVVLFLLLGVDATKASIDGPAVATGRPLSPAVGGAEHIERAVPDAFHQRFPVETEAGFVPIGVPPIAVFGNQSIGRGGRVTTGRTRLAFLEPLINAFTIPDSCAGPTSFGVLHVRSNS